MSQSSSVTNSSAGNDDCASSIDASLLYVDDLADQPDDYMASPYSTVAAQDHVPMKLELHSFHFSKWRSLQDMCGKFGPLSHIDGTTPSDPTPLHGTKRTVASVLGSTALSLTKSSTSQ